MSWTFFVACWAKSSRISYPVMIAARA